LATRFWRDERFLQALGQAAFLLLVLFLAYALYNNMVRALQQQGLVTGFSFLQQTAGFDIGERLISYSRSSSYLRAFQVGLLNTILVSALGILFATALGMVVGVARLSTNYLVKSIAKAYIEIIRNIPLLVLLVFWYTGFFLKLPTIKEAWILPGPIYFTNRGIVIPWGIPTASFRTYLWILTFGLLITLGMTWLLILKGRRTGRPPRVTLWSLVTFLGVAVLGWLLLPQSPLTVDIPYIDGLNIAAGLTLSPEFMALVSGLVIYTAAFIGEIVRAGVQSVSKGQLEAARALGLNAFQSLRLVVFPQALRVIVPPLTSQYLNLTKNSSLAIAIGYPELFSVSGTIFNQTGRAVEVITLIMATYLSISLLTSLFMNWYNRKVRLAER
jgi:general L-amino acid transport system permease protein